MPSKVTLKFTKGKNAGKEYVYAGKESLVLGRQDDCSVILPENTVSRYHCMLEIMPPKAVVRDFGSLNGTYLNGKIIGQRPEGMTVEAARQQIYNEFELKDGDTLRFGTDCEMQITTYQPQHCCDCKAELPEDGSGRFESSPGMFICAVCKKNADDKAERERAEAEAAKRRLEELAAKEKAAADERIREAAAKARAEEEKRMADLKARLKADEENRERQRQAAAKNMRQCMVCGKQFPDSADAGICPECAADPEKIIMFILKQARAGEGGGPEIKGYRNLRMLGRGGMGQVWLVEEEATKKQMALKVMLPQAAAEEHNKKLFSREAQLACQMEHKNIVRHYKSGRSGDLFYILMEFCDGGSVDSLMQKAGGRLSIDAATDIICQALTGLEYAHNTKVKSEIASGAEKKAWGIVHRDFKPGNIFLCRDGNKTVAKVADFGLAKAFDTAGLSDITKKGSAAGSPHFMPRQQIINYKYARPEVDVFAAAASYYFMLTGEFPKVSKNARGEEVFIQVLKNSAVPIRRHNPAVPSRLAEAIDAALTDNPDIRIKSAAEFKKMIERAL